jgi:hypothetical protein
LKILWLAPTPFRIHIWWVNFGNCKENWKCKKNEDAGLKEPMVQLKKLEFKELVWNCDVPWISPWIFVTCNLGFGRTLKILCRLLADLSTISESTQKSVLNKKINFLKISRKMCKKVWIFCQNNNNYKH